jgi:RNA polymerase sigma-70 factor (ECF subfamily)
VTEAELDEDLVRRFRAGEAQAFTDLVLRHQQRVYSLCLRVLGDADAAADVAQDTFLTVLRKLDGFRGDAAFTSWLHRVTVNACYDELRRKRRGRCCTPWPTTTSNTSPAPTAIMPTRSPTR